MSKSVTVFVVDDDELHRDSICALVSSMGLAVEAFASAEEFLACFHGKRRGCLVTDLRMRGMDGIELLEILTQRDINLPTIIVTAFARTVTTVRAMETGAVTLLDKPYADDDLWHAIRKALKKEADDEANRQRIQTIRLRLDSLTPEKRQVLDRMVSGDTNKSIAMHLDIGLRTVETRRHEVLCAMKADSLAEIVRMVVEAEMSSYPRKSEQRNLSAGSR